MKKVLDYLNIYKNIKKYMTLKKVKNYTQTKNNRMGVIIVDILIVIAFAVTFYYVFFINTSPLIKNLGIAAIVLFVVFSIIRITVFVQGYDRKFRGIRKLVLIDEQGINQKEWDIKGKTSILIGKNSKDSEVDIDLSGSEYSSLVSRQHAVLNYTESKWYVEDIGSANGSGIQKINDNSKLKIEKGKPYQLDSGDIIYIANTKILIQ